MLPTCPPAPPPPLRPPTEPSFDVPAPPTPASRPPSSSVFAGLSSLHASTTTPASKQPTTPWPAHAMIPHRTRSGSPVAPASDGLRVVFVRRGGRLSSAGAEGRLPPPSKG